MDSQQLNWIANFIWGIADDVLRDLYVRGKYRDVILPMTVLRRLDAVLEPTKQAVLHMKASLDKAKIANQDQALRQAAGQAFYNTSKFTLRDLRARSSQQQLKAAMNDPTNPGHQSVGTIVASAFVGALVSSGVVTFIGEQFAARRAENIVQEVRAEFQRQERVTEWKRQSLALLVAPVVMQLDRTKRAFLRYEANNRFLESEILYKGNLAVRDMLLGNGHLIPEDLREVSGRLIEHYDRWLEEYERVRGDRKLAPDEPFVFAGPKGYPFPQGADNLFAQSYDRLVSELYGTAPR